MSEKTTSTRKLHKSRKDKIVDGVCGGVAEYFHMDPTIIRILWFVSFLMNGLGIWAYIIAAIIVPPNPEHINLEESEKKQHNPQLLWGSLLIILGILFLFNIWNFPFFWHWPFHCWNWNMWALPWATIGPILLIGIGVFYIFNILRADKHPEKQSTIESNNEKQLKRPLNNRMIAGVCAAFANHFKIDPTWIRIGYILLAILTHGGPLIILYIVLIFIIPKESEIQSS